ncbi:MAG: hypothetical protein HJJLKODD_02750 [Phycisphaerae bacterium]|nr:hypothetical protein [Phycisphaerae bacterium]
MPIMGTCPVCQHVYVSPDKAIGLKIKCERCHAIMRITPDKNAGKEVDITLVPKRRSSKFMPIIKFGLFGVAGLATIGFIAWSLFFKSPAAGPTINSKLIQSVDQAIIQSQRLAEAQQFERAFGALDVIRQQVRQNGNDLQLLTKINQAWTQISTKAEQSRSQTDTVEAQASPSLPAANRYSDD